jgi:hypothetical protein
MQITTMRTFLGDLDVDYIEANTNTNSYSSGLLPLGAALERLIIAPLTGAFFIYVLLVSVYV